MILAVDIGNSNIVLGCIEDRKIKKEARIATDLIKTSDQYCAELKNMLDLLEIPVDSIEGSIISSVVPPLLNSFKTAIRKLTGKVPLVVGPGIKTGLNILLDNPALAGGDLIVAAVAALAEYPAPMLIIDMGTATTITAIDEKKNYLGGCICPGVKISAEALSGRTAQLPAISLEAPQKAIGRNTIDSMRSGLMMGSAAMLDGMIDRMEEELGHPVTVIATGGIARFVIPMCRRKIHYDKDLLLKGLLRLYENNKRPGGFELMASYQPDKIFAPDAPIRALAERGATPFYLYDEAGIRRSAQRLLKSFAFCPNYENFVPIRENPNPAVLALLKMCGCGVCASNLTELQLAARCEFQGTKLLYEPMVKDPQAAALACQLQARWLINSPALLPDVPLKRVILRYHLSSFDIPNLSRRMNRSRNGMTKEQLLQTAASLHRSGTEEIGLATQSAAYSLQAGLLARRAKVLRDLAESVTRETSVPVGAIYLGDGPGLPYRPKLACPSLEQEAQALEPVISSWEPQPTVLTGICKQLLEPHGLMVVKVLELRRFDQSFLMLDGGFNQYLRPALKQAFRHISVLGQSQVEGRRRYVLSGPTFDERDRLSEGRMLPPVLPGDFCVVHDVGCGGRAMALLYASQPVAAEYLYTTDGEIRCIGAGRSSREVLEFLYEV